MTALEPSRGRLERKTFDNPTLGFRAHWFHLQTVVCANYIRFAFRHRHACVPGLPRKLLSIAPGSGPLDLGKLLSPLPLARRPAPPDEANPQDQEPRRKHDPANVGEVDQRVGLRRLGGENREEEG
jgi:hypothetical protein